MRNNHDTERNIKHRAITIEEVRAFDNQRLFFRLRENRNNICMILQYGCDCEEVEFARMIVVTGVNIERILGEIDVRLERGCMGSGLVDGKCPFRMR